MSLYYRQQKPTQQYLLYLKDTACSLRLTLEKHGDTGDGFGYGFRPGNISKEQGPGAETLQIEIEQTKTELERVGDEIKRVEASLAQVEQDRKQ